MNEKELGIVLKAKADIDRAFKELQDRMKGSSDDAAKNAKKTSDEYERAFQKVRNTAAVAFAAVGAAIGFSVKEAVEAQSGLDRARAVVELNGKSWEEMGSKVQAAATRIQETSTFTDDQAVAAFTRLTLVTGDASKGLEYLGTTADMASAFGLDLEQTSQMVAQAMEGQIGKLGRLVPALKNMDDEIGKNATEDEKLAYVMDKLGAATKDLAEKKLHTAAGKLAEVKKWTGELGETIGNIFLPMVLKAAEFATAVAKGLRAWAEEHPFLTKMILGGTVAILGITMAFTGVVLTAMKVVTAIKAVQTALLMLKALNPEYLLMSLAVGASVGAGMYLLSGALMAAGTSAITIQDRFVGLSTALGGTSEQWRNLYEEIEKNTGAAESAEARFQDYIAIIADGKTAGLSFAQSLKVATEASGDASKATALITIEQGKMAAASQLARYDLKSVKDILAETKTEEQYRAEIGRLKEAFAATSDTLQRGKISQLIADIRDEMKQLATGAEPAKGSLAAIRKEYGEQVVTLTELNKRRDVASDMLKSTDTAVQAFGLARLREIEKQIRDLLSAGRDVESFMEEQRGGWSTPIGPAPREAGGEVIEERKRKALDAGLSYATAIEIATTSMTEQEVDRRIEIARLGANAEVEARKEAMETLHTAWMTTWESFGDIEMTGSQRIKAIFSSLVTSMMHNIAEVTWKWITASHVRVASTAAAVAQTTSLNTAGAASEKANALVVMAAWIKAAYMKLVAWFSFAGPFAPALALGVMVAAVAAAGALAAKALGMQKGGVVPGTGRGDTVPVLLEPGERVMTRRIQERYGALLDRLERGNEVFVTNMGLQYGGIVGMPSKAGSPEVRTVEGTVGGRTVIVQLSLDRDTTTERMAEMRAQFDQWVVPAIENALDRGSLKLRYGLGG